MMKLGMITTPNVEGVEKLMAYGLKNAEFCINVGSNVEGFKSQVPSIKEVCELKGISIGSIGRWGSDRVTAEGINKEEFVTECALIDSAAELSCPVYVSNCNPVEGIDFDRNCQLAVEYLGALVKYAEDKGVKVCTYNCKWNSFINSEETWCNVHTQIPQLGLKYDPSHSIAAGRDYLEELEKWGNRVYHVHLKGSLYVGGRHIDDPPAGLDGTRWHEIMALLYYKGYDGMLSIEPHSTVWQGELGKSGVSYTIDYFKKMIF